MLATLLASRLAAVQAAPPPDPSTVEPDPSAPIVVSAPEPRYAAPTRYDRIGRVWVPVWINGQGPFRLVLDTGASQSALGEALVQALGAALPRAERMMLNGATGSRLVPAVQVDSLVAGDVALHGGSLPIVQDALGGADGVMGTEGLLEQRIRIDFAHDRVDMRRSQREPAPAGFVTVALQLVDGLLVIEDATVGGVPTRVVVDTGGQGSVANEALRRALRRRLRAQDANASELVGATLDAQRGDRMVLPEMQLGALRISPAEVTVGDFHIFEYWHLTQTPTLLLGMDVLGLVDTLIIDYPRRELQVRTN